MPDPDSDKSGQMDEIGGQSSFGGLPTTMFPIARPTNIPMIAPSNAPKIVPTGSPEVAAHAPPNVAEIPIPNNKQTSRANIAMS
jgi:hypothetical protein